MDTSNASYKVRRCSKCLRDMKYHCVSCPSDLCSQCKENHVTTLKTIDHKVVLHRERLTEYQKPNYVKNILKKFIESFAKCAKFLRVIIAKGIENTRK